MGEPQATPSPCTAMVAGLEGLRGRAVGDALCFHHLRDIRGIDLAVSRSMFRGGPNRADGFRYRGRQRYSLTICTHKRQHTFRSAMIVNRVLYHLKQAAARAGFEISAYCFMPDHLHLLTEGLLEDADLRLFVHEFKQRSAFEYGRAEGQPLWQPRYYDHVLRNDEATQSVAGYIIQNPVRAGLVEDPRRYPFLGSEVYAVEDLLESVRW